MSWPLQGPQGPPRLVEGWLRAQVRVAEIEQRLAEVSASGEALGVSRGRCARTAKAGDSERFGALASQWEAEYRLPAGLVAAVLEAESGGEVEAVSPKGALGLMQLMPETAGALGVADALDPEQNVRGGARYLRQMLDRFGSLPLALAAYNAGPGAVRQYGGVPPFAETRRYVATVLESLWRQGRASGGGEG